MLLFLSAALAQHVDLDHGEVLTAADLPFEALTVGHPSLQYRDGRFVMLFEAKVSWPGCDTAYAIGRATSPDGLQWSFERNSVRPSAAHPCGLRRPAAAATDDGVLVAMEDVLTAEIVVVRRFAEGDSQRWTTTGLEGLTEVSVARRDGDWVVAATDPDQGLVFATSDDAMDWAVAEDAGLIPGTTWWSRDAIRSPSLSCYDGSSLQWVIHYGGTVDDTVGFTWGKSTDLDTWYLSLAAEIWEAPDAWASWDAVTSPSAAWIAYEHDGGIGFATTDDSVPGDDAATRDCHP